VKGKPDIGDQINKRIIAPLAKENKLFEIRIPDRPIKINRTPTERKNSGNSLGRRLTWPRRETKLSIAKLPLWGPGGHDKRAGPRESQLGEKGARQMKSWNGWTIVAMGSLAVAIVGRWAIAAAAEEAKEPPTADKHPVKLNADFSDWEKLNAQALEEYARPIQPGIPGERPFWNSHTCRFTYAPAFDFKPVEGATSYRFTVTHVEVGGKDLEKRLTEKDWVFEAAEPWAALTPIWNDLPAGTGRGEYKGNWSPDWKKYTGPHFEAFKLKVEGLDKQGGQVVGVAKLSNTVDTRYFQKAPGPFQGPVVRPKEVAGLRQAALGHLRRVLGGQADGSQYGLRFFKEQRLPLDFSSKPLNKEEERKERDRLIKEDGKFAEGIIHPTGLGPISISMAFLARETDKPEEAAAALKTAKNAVDSFITCAFPPDWKWGYLGMPNLRDPGKVNWTGYLAGEITFEQFLKQQYDRVQQGITIVWDSRAAEESHMYLDLYAASKEKKYLDAAVRLADTYRKNQLPCGTWYACFNPKTGEPIRGYEKAMHQPAFIIRFLDRLAVECGIHEYEETADRAFGWMLENQAKPMNTQGHFWDVSCNQPPYVDLGALSTSDVAVCLFDRADKHPEYAALGENLIRMVEDVFVFWPAGETREQLGFYVPVGFSAGGVLDGFWRAYRETGNPLYLAKALKIAYRVMANPGPWAADARASVNVLEFHAFLKQHGLPGAE